jgi:hypothetical protein
MLRCVSFSMIFKSAFTVETLQRLRVGRETKDDLDGTYLLVIEVNYRDLLGRAKKNRKTPQPRQPMYFIHNSNLAHLESNCRALPLDQHVLSLSARIIFSGLCIPL